MRGSSVRDAEGRVVKRTAEHGDVEAGADGVDEGVVNERYRVGGLDDRLLRGAQAGAATLLVGCGETLGEGGVGGRVLHRAEVAAACLDRRPDEEGHRAGE